MTAAGWLAVFVATASAFPYALKTPGLPPPGAAVYPLGDLIG